MNKSTILFLSFSLSLFLFSNVSAQDNDRAKEIFEEVETLRNAVKSEITNLEMIIYDSRNRTRNRSLQSFSSFEKETEKTLLVFESPANVKGTAFLTIDEGSSSAQKLYLPALGRVQQITSSERGDRFMGSDFTYEDLAVQNADNYDFELISEAENKATIKATSKEESKYAYILFYINTERYVLEKAEYFNASDEIIKRLESSDFVNVEANIWRANSMVMYDLKENTKTELNWTNREINVSIPDWRFTERAFRRMN